MTFTYNYPDEKGYFGEFGGKHVPPELEPVLEELEKIYAVCKADPAFQAEYNDLLNHYVGRATPVYFAERLSGILGGAKIYLKREDLCHTGAHKLNNALGQVLMAKRMGKTRIIAETGAGQHGVATATACARLGLKCVIYMGEVDMHRQALNVYRMRLLGAEVRPATGGSRVLKDAVDEALLDWVRSYKDTHYVIGSAVGPHPFPMIVRDFQSVIGREAKQQIVEMTGRLPDVIVACIGGGSNSMGLFHAFLDDTDVKIVGVEAGGTDVKRIGHHAARFVPEGKVGVVHGMRTYMLQDDKGEPAHTHSVSAGLDYVAVSPEHANLFAQKRVQYANASDSEAIEAFMMLSKLEGILPALESSHAVAWAIKNAPSMSAETTMLINLSGRGDKDVDQLRNIIPDINNLNMLSDS